MKGTASVLHPNQFQVNEAWIAFKVNDAPVHTEADGDFHCIALMDAASCFILTMDLAAVGERYLSKKVAQLLLKNGHAHKATFPKTLYMAHELPADELSREAEHKKIAVVRVPEIELLPFIGDAREGFKASVGGV